MSTRFHRDSPTNLATPRSALPPQENHNQIMAIAPHHGGAKNTRMHLNGSRFRSASARMLHGTKTYFIAKQGLVEFLRHVTKLARMPLDCKGAVTHEPAVPNALLRRLHGFRSMPEGAGAVTSRSLNALQKVKETDHAEPPYPPRP
jgi:hypothetical protein